MIALPGLLLSTCRLSEAREALELYIGAMQNGLTPNFFNDAGEAAAYNSADATLWTFAAAREYLQRSGDEEFAHWAYPRLADSMVRLRAGTDFSIYEDGDGLLCAGMPETQLTWMDAKADGQAVTPRWHKPVEVQALWHSAVKTVALLAGKVGEARVSEEMGAYAEAISAAFLAAFWDEGRGYLADCVLPWGADGVLRPNQVIALALPDGLVPDDIAKRCLAAVEAKLVTPYGLRSLDPDAPGYCAIYAGGQFARDRAYHQGTVWAWLMGPYVRAKMRILGEGDEAKLWARTLLAPLIAHLDAAGLGQISEIFDAQAPHMPRGCYAQAWSVAEVLRAWIDFGLGELA
jgi:predicted glycogen debranching enzyme